LNKAGEKNMSKKLLPYYLSRTAIALAIGAFLVVTGSPIWMAALIGGLILGLFILAPLSGRYAVHPEYGVTALRRDDRTQAINDRAARNAFVVSMLTIAAAAFYYRSSGAGQAPVQVLEIILGIGALAYFISDFFLRKI
jgi:hypothetical protein